MPKLPLSSEPETGKQKAHASLKWLLTLMSAVITTGLVVVLNHQL